jgi:hypothetical protein
MFSRISHHVIWYKINISKENAACIFATLIVKVNVKVKVTPWHSHAKTEWEVEVQLIPIRLLYPWKKPGTHFLGCHSRHGESHGTKIRSPDQPVRSKSLYRLSNPVRPPTINMEVKYFPLIIQMEEEHLSKTMVTFYQKARRHVVERSIIHIRLHDNLRSEVKVILCKGLNSLSCTFNPLKCGRFPAKGLYAKCCIIKTIVHFACTACLCVSQDSQNSSNYFYPWLFWDVTWWRLVAGYRRAGTTYWSRLGLFDFWRWNLIVCPETSLTNYTKLNIRGEWSPQLNCCDSLKSHTNFFAECHFIVRSSNGCTVCFLGCAN